MLSQAPTWVALASSRCRSSRCDRLLPNRPFWQKANEVRLRPVSSELSVSPKPHPRTLLAGAWYLFARVHTGYRLRQWSPSAAKARFPTHCPVPMLMTSGAGSRRMSHKRMVLSELVVAENPLVGERQACDSGRVTSRTRICRNDGSSWSGEDSHKKATLSRPPDASSLPNGRTADRKPGPCVPLKSECSGDFSSPRSLIVSSFDPEANNSPSGEKRGIQLAPDAP